MKSIKHSVLISVCLGVLLCLTSCDHDVTTASIVHEDGAIERTIVLYEADSSKITRNIMGISEAKGWSTAAEPASLTQEGNAKEKEVTITFKKHFASVAEANGEMDGSADTLFRIHSTFEKENRWFYTYLEYSDTYRSMNPFKAVRREDYFTREDYAFIDRLPSEGKPISKSDSLYLARLNEKIFDIYGSRTIFEELYSHMLNTMTDYQIAQNWKDTLSIRKENIYEKFGDDFGDDKHGFLHAIDFFGIPLPPPARKAFLEKSRAVEKRVEFVADAASGKFKHVIRMPWNVIESNADSVSNNEVHWHPPVIKFLLTDYTMTARARKMNIWAVVISGGVILATLGLFFIRRRT